MVGERDSPLAMDIGASPREVNGHLRRQKRFHSLGLAEMTEEHYSTFLIAITSSVNFGVRCCSTLSSTESPALIPSMETPSLR